jgi:hypothetical protein
LYALISSLKRSELFTAIHVLELIDEQSVKLIKIKAEIRDGSLLFVTELHTDEYQKYSYHWQKQNGELIMRWDNKPHWKKMKTFPHHKHDRDKVLPSHRINMDEVISEIEKSLNQMRRTGGT